MRWFIAVCCAAALTACVQEGGGPKPQKIVIDRNDNDFMRPESDQPVTSETRGRSKTHVELGTAYMSEGKYGVALDEAKIAIAYDRTYAPAHLLLAQTYAYLEQFSPADSAYREAMRLAPSDPQINNSYGWFLCSQKREKEGLALLEASVRNPYYNTPTQAYTNAGLCYLNLQDSNSAEREFIKAHQVDAKNGLALYYLAVINYRTKNYEGARQWLGMLQKQLTSQTAAVLWLGLQIEHAQGNRSGEAEYATKLRKDFPASAEYKAFLQGNYE